MSRSNDANSEAISLGMQLVDEEIRDNKKAVLEARSSSPSSPGSSAWSHAAPEAVTAGQSV